MPLVKPLLSGDLPKRSSSGDKLITSGDIATAVKSTFTNRSAVAPQTYPDIFGSLLQYTEGVPVTVQYFKKRGPYINNQTIDTSFSLERAAVHFSFDLIHNFEIRIKDQLSIEIDADSTETMVTGIAIIYPGFKPNVGDMFYMKLPDSRIGVFAVNLTEPLTITRGTHYQVSFHLDSFLSETTDQKLMDCVIDNLYFETQQYFGGEAVLLTDTSYSQLKTLLRMKSSIISRLVNKFYNNPEQTILRPDNVYDPYLVEYLSNKISIDDTRRQITQLPNPYVAPFENTIWAVLLYQDISRLELVAYTLTIYRQFLFDVNMSNIDKFRMVTLIDTDQGFDAKRVTQAKFNNLDATFRQVSYHFSNRFYLALLKSFDEGAAILDIVPFLDEAVYENLTETAYAVSDNTYHDMAFFDTHNISTGSNNNMHLPELEYVVFDFIVNDHIDVTHLVDNVLSRFPFAAMTEMDQLYYMATFLHLIDVALNRIR